MGQSSTLGRAAEFYVAAVLSRKSVWATPFSGNLPGYDLAAIRPDGALRLIQVKASGPKSRNKKIGSWWLGKAGYASGKSDYFLGLRGLHAGASPSPATSSSPRPTR